MALTKAEKKDTADVLDAIEDDLRQISANDRQPVVNAHEKINTLRASLSLAANGDAE